MVSMRPLLDDEEVLLPTVLCSILFAVSATGNTTFTNNSEINGLNSR